MNVLKSAQRTLSISLDGVREAVIAVAERVAHRVQTGKLQLQMEETEHRLQQAYASLGRCLYDVRTTPPVRGTAVDTALPLGERIRAEQRRLQDLRDRLASRSEDTLGIPLLRLQEDLREGGGTVERVTIHPGSQADGKTITQLALPVTLRIVMIRRGEALLVPDGNTILKAGDDVTVLGIRSAIPGALRTLCA